MVKVICLGLEGGVLLSNQYTTPKGNTYVFDKGIPTEVKDKEDLEYFLKCGNGKLFKAVGIKEKIKEKITPKEAPASHLEDGSLNPDYNWTEEELFKLNKKEQTELLKKLGAGRIPRTEKERVKMILKLKG